MKNAHRLWALLAILPLSGLGCIMTLTGSGEMGIGFRSDNMLVMYHKADEGNEAVAVSEIDTDPLVENIVDLGWADEPIAADLTPVPPTDDPG